MFDSVFNEVVTREYQPINRFTFSRRRCIPSIGVNNLECLKSQAFHLHSCVDAVSPPFDCDFSLSLPHLLLVAKEDGLVHLFNTEHRGPESLLKYYGVHDNAIFSVKWITRANRFLTASGDQTIKLVDAETGLVLSVYVGHTMSVRSLALCSRDNNIFASASRDGSVRIWDLRTQSSEGVGSSLHIQGCHLPFLDSTTCRSRPKSRKSATESQSVTCVVFARDFELVSAGSTDGIIKIWDIRRFPSSGNKQPQPVTALPYKGTSQKQCGYSDLILDSSGSRLYASCLDHTIYEYDLTSPSTRPVFLYTGHLTASFYIKTSLSLDNSYLACGSADNRAYIYRVGARIQRPLVLSGHTGEVSIPRWSPHDPTRMVTLSDSAQLFVWHMFPAREYTMPESGELRGLTECLSQPTMTAEKQANLLVPASPQKPSSSVCSTASPVSSKLSFAGGPPVSVLESPSSMARRRRQLNIRNFLMDLPQTSEVTSRNGGTRNTTPSVFTSAVSESEVSVEVSPTRRSPLVSGSRIVHRYPFPPSASTSSSAYIASQNTPCGCEVTARPQNIDSKTEDLENSLPSNSSTSTDSNSHHRNLHHHCNHRQLGLFRDNNQEVAPSLFSDITNSPSRLSRKRPMVSDDEVEGQGNKSGSHSPICSRTSSGGDASFVPSFSVSLTPGSAPRRRRTLAPTPLSAGTLSPSTPNRQRRRSTLRPVAVVSGRNSIRNYFKPPSEA